MAHRLYTFVANHYLSPLQCGLQTAHVVSELSRAFKVNTNQAKLYSEWADMDKTIIICGAGNHQGVVDCFMEIMRTGGDALDLPAAIFHEDAQSMNFMATACGVIVPEEYWNVGFDDGTGNPNLSQRYFYSRFDNPAQPDVATSIKIYPLTHPEGQFIQHIKSFRLA